MTRRSTPSWQGIAGSTTERGYGWAWQKRRERILLRDEGWCVLCRARGLDVLATCVDHIIPKHQAGSDAPSNLQSLCDPCHAVKTQAEGARAQGRRPKVRQRIGPDGWPL
jgi:5-methylcytosine-specific restriction enzyme A